MDLSVGKKMLTSRDPSNVDLWQLGGRPSLKDRLIIMYNMLELIDIN